MEAKKPNVFEQRRIDARQAKEPQPLPPKRPHSLSSPQPLHQPQSTLIGRLAPEIRHKIWTEVLGGHHLHIVRASKRLLAINCVENVGPDLDTRKHICWGETDRNDMVGETPGFYIGPRKNDTSAKAANLLPLLQVCRLVYIEAISILYSDNIFDIDHVDTFVYLQQTVLSERLNRIRVVNFRWDFLKWTNMTSPLDTLHGIASWTDVCNILAGIADLQELTIHMDGGNMGPNYDYGSRRIEHLKGIWTPILETLKRVKPSNKFVVFVPWEEGECREMAKGCGFPFILAAATPYIGFPH